MANVVLTACAAPAPLGAPAALPPPDPVASRPVSPPPKDQGDLRTGSPPDGRWLTDKQGRAYFLESWPKSRAVRVDARTVRLPGGFLLEVEQEDATHYFYRAYRPLDLPGMAPAEALRPNPQDLARIAATYAIEVEESRRLRATWFGRGLPQAGQWRDGFAVADLNGDGHPMIVHGPPRKSMGGPVVFVGDGQGNWRRWSEARFPPLPYDYGTVQVGDLNGDGHLGLVFGVHLRGVIALQGDGRGRFVDASRGLEFAGRPAPGVAPPFSSTALRLVDWDGDGRLAILALGEGPRFDSPGGGSRGVVLYRRHPDGSWQRQPAGPMPQGLFGGALALGDFAGDGRLGFATASGVWGRRDLVNLRTPDGEWRAVTVETVRPMAYVMAVAAANFDRDGRRGRGEAARSDLAVGYVSYEGGVWRSGLDVLLPRPDGTWSRRVLAAWEGGEGVTALATGDLNGDGRPDLVALTGRGETLVFLGDGRGGFTREVDLIPPFPGRCRGSAVVLADLDGDGRDDIVASFAPPSTERRLVETPEAICPSEGGLAAWRIESVP